MRLPLPWIRYLLILIPAISTLYLAAISSYGMYTLHILIFLWVAQIRNKWIPKPFYYFGMIFEIGFAGWIIYIYDGLLFLLLFSTLVSLYESTSNHFKIPYILMIFVILNYTMIEALPLLWVLSNTMLISFVLLLQYVHSTTDRNVKIEQLNDQLRQQHYDLDAARVRLVEYSREVQQIAQVEERNRISREIHDDLGHKLIRLKMMLEAIVTIMPTQQAKGMEMIVQVRDQLRESTETLRRTVRKMKPTEQISNSYSLHHLMDDFAESCGVQMNYVITGKPLTLYPSEEFVLYRNAQEAMTNAVRHGKATEVSLQLNYGIDHLEFSISNNGLLPDRIDKKGLGLSGMEERVRILGGELRIEYTDQFTVTTRIPHHENDEQRRKG